MVLRRADDEALRCDAGTRSLALPRMVRLMRLTFIALNRACIAELTSCSKQLKPNFLFRVPPVVRWPPKDGQPNPMVERASLQATNDSPAAAGRTAQANLCSAALRLC